MKKNIYDYIMVVNEAVPYFIQKYNLDYDQTSDICLQFLINYLIILKDNKIVRNHFKALYLTKLDDYFRLNRRNLNTELKVNKPDLNALEAIIAYLFNIKKYPIYQISDLLNLDGYIIGNIIDNIDFKRTLKI